MRIALFAYSSAGTKVFNHLRSLGHEIVAVFTHTPDPHEKEWFTPISHLAGEAGIPVFFCPSHTRLPRSLADDLRRLAPDLILSVWFRSLLPAEALSLCPAVNVHASLLPLYRGRCPINWVLVNGERTTGVTLHRMEPTPDTGEILRQTLIPINPDLTAPELLELSEATALLQIDSYLREPHLPGRPQTGPSSSYGGRRPSDGKFSFDWPARRIHNLVRAVTHPWPGAFTRVPCNPTHTRPNKIRWINEEGPSTEIYVWKTNVLNANTLHPGIPFTLGDHLLYGTSDNAIEIVTWSFPGGPDRPGIELLNYLK